MPSINKDLEYALNPAQWAEDVLGVKLDPWQVQALRSSAKQSIWNIHRQAGKSSIASIKALGKAIFKPGSLTLMVSKSERQSGELYRKFLSFYDRLETPPGMPEDKALSCTLANGSRVVALPGIEDTIRSFSAVSLIIEDEASRVPDELYVAIRPMLAVSNGSLILMSTPNGSLGHFYKTWTEGGPSWSRIKVTADQCPRITPEFLAEERLNMSENEYLQEYFGEFLDPEGAVFSSELFRSLESADLKPFKLED
jgi:hypothetical protein